MKAFLLDNAENCQKASPKAKLKAIFLDRDGVINHYPGDGKYVTDIKEFKFLPGAKKAITLLKKNNFPVFVISNQAGVGKGVYSQRALAAITKNMLEGLKKSHATLDGVYYCTHKQEDNCACRKPKAGMIQQALQGKAISVKDSFFIGDTLRDILTAKAAGCKSILVLSGKEKLANRKNWDTQPDFVFRNLIEAAKFIASL